MLIAQLLAWSLLTPVLLAQPVTPSSRTDPTDKSIRWERGMTDVDKAWEFYKNLGAVGLVAGGGVLLRNRWKAWQGSQPVILPSRGPRDAMQLLAADGPEHPQTKTLRLIAEANANRHRPPQFSPVQAELLQRTRSPAVQQYPLTFLRLISECIEKKGLQEQNWDPSSARSFAIHYLKGTRNFNADEVTLLAALAQRCLDGVVTQTEEIKKEIDVLGIEAPSVPAPDSTNPMMVNDGNRKLIDDTLRSTTKAMNGMARNVRDSFRGVSLASLGSLRPVPQPRWAPALRPVR